MKRIFFLSCLAVLAIQMHAQTYWKDAINVASYKDYDTTSFIYDISDDVKFICVDFPAVSSDDIVLFVGVPDVDAQGIGNLTWTSGATTADSVILDKTLYTQKIRRKDGTRYETTRIYLYFEEGMPAKRVSFTFVWGTAATGTIKIGWRD